jgi:hypothetical protein
MRRDMKANEKSRNSGWTILAVVSLLTFAGVGQSSAQQSEAKPGATGGGPSPVDTIEKAQAIKSLFYALDAKKFTITWNPGSVNILTEIGPVKNAENKTVKNAEGVYCAEFKYWIQGFLILSGTCPLPQTSKPVPIWTYTASPNLSYVSPNEFTVRVGDDTYTLRRKGKEAELLKNEKPKPASH